MSTKSKVKNDNIIEIKNLKKYYNLTSGILKKVTGQVRAVDDVSFSISFIYFCFHRIDRKHR